MTVKVEVKVTDNSNGDLAKMDAVHKPTCRFEFLTEAKKYFTRQTKTPQLPLSGWTGCPQNSSLQWSKVNSFQPSSTDFAFRYILFKPYKIAH